MSSDALMKLFAAGAGIKPCPGCAASIEFRSVNQGQSLDVIHPQPPCPTFREFVAKLHERHAQNLAKARGTLIHVKV